MSCLDVVSLSKKFLLFLNELFSYSACCYASARAGTRPLLRRRSSAHVRPRYAERRVKTGRERCLCCCEEPETPGCFVGAAAKKLPSPQPGDGRGDTLRSQTEQGRAYRAAGLAAENSALFGGYGRVFVFMRGGGGWDCPRCHSRLCPPAPGGGGCALLRGRGSEPLSRSRRNPKYLGHRCLHI